jgi:hypothetical protein
LTTGGCLWVPLELFGVTGSGLVEVSLLEEELEVLVR